MDVPVFKDAVIHAQQVDMRLDVFQGDDSRFLHHVSQVTGQGKLALSSLAQRGFDKENLAAHRGPCKSCYYSCIIVALIDVAGEWGGAENLLQV